MQDEVTGYLSLQVVSEPVAIVQALLRTKLKSHLQLPLTVGLASHCCPHLRLYSYLLENSFTYLLFFWLCRSS